MNIIYKAIDGKMFEVKEECERYEAQFLDDLKNAEIEFYECDGTLMPISLESLVNCSFIYVKNEKDLEVLEWMSDCTKTIVPSECGFWRWGLCGWESLEDDLKPWMNIYKIVCRIIPDLKKS